MTAKTYPAGTTLHCNRCNKPFAAPKEIHAGEFCGSAAARITGWEDFCTCPECGQTDSHWIFAIDVMPAFEGTNYQIEKQRKNWMRNN